MLLNIFDQKLVGEFVFIAGIDLYIQSLNLPHLIQLKIKNEFDEHCDIHQPILFGFVDAAHANFLTKRRSTTGIVFTFCGGAIVYKSKTQF